MLKVNNSIYGAFRQSALAYFWDPALYYQNKTFQYGKVLNNVDKFAAGLQKLGVNKRDVVTIVMPNIPQVVYALYATNKLDAVAYLIHPLTPSNKLKEMMKTVGSKHLIILNIASKTYADIIEDKSISVILCSPAGELGGLKRTIYGRMHKDEIIDVKNHSNVYSDRELLKSDPHGAEIDYGNPRATSIYLNSGGTTGDPKVIELSSYALNALNANDEYILEVENFRNLYMFDVLPVFHGFGLAMGVHAFITHGGCVTLMPKFHTLDTIKLINKGKINYLIGVPTLYEALLHKKEFSGKGLKNLKIAFVGGDFVSPHLIERFNQRMQENGSKAVMFEGYGLTETVTVSNVNTLTFNKKGSVGRPLPNLQNKIFDSETMTELKTGEIGEIYIGGETIMNGYFSGQEQPFYIDENGKKWTRTGDMGYIDADGYLFFKQRLKRILKVSGVYVFPSEIEKIATSFDGILDACAVGIEDAFKGVKIRLYLKADEGFDTTGIGEKISALIKLNVSDFAIPKEYVFLKKMPTTIVGKIDYKQLNKEDFKEEQ